jgi:predicted extracellular nuclease
MPHRWTAPASLALALAACNNITPEDTTDGPTGGTSTGTTDGADPTGDPSTGPTTGEPTTDGPTSSPTSSPTGDPTGDPTGETDTAGEDVTIYDIQGGKIAPKTTVTVKGVIVTSPVQVEKGALFIEEPEGGEFSGIQLYMYDEVVAALDAPIGSVVTVTGLYDEFYGSSQITVMAVGDIEVTGTGEVPAPAVVAAADVANDGALAENYEGVLIEIQDATVTDPDLGPEQIGQFEVEGGAHVSDFFLFPLGMSPKPAMGQVYPSIVGPLLYSFDQFQIAPRSLADLGEEGTDTDTDTDTTTDTGGEGVTIFDIQQGMVTLGDPVTVTDVIVTSPLTFKKDGFFVQDPQGGEFSGIYVYINMHAVNVKPGDKVTVTGVYDEFFDFSQIKIAGPGDVVVNGNGPVPAPAVVAADDIATGGPLAENYEAVLVRVEDVTVSTAADNFGEWIVEGSLHVDDLFFAKADWPLPMVGDTFTSLTGPLAYSFDNFKLSPRTAADLVE